MSAKRAKPTSRKKYAATAGLTIGGIALPLAGTANAASIEAWDKVAQCESSGLWNRPDGDFGKSSGGLQFQPASWNDALAYLRRQGIDTSGYPQGSGHQAYKATKRQQIIAGEALLALQGPGAWTCNAKVGYPLKTSGPNASMFKGGVNPYAGSAPTPPAAPSSVAAEVLKLVNAERAKVGAKPLAADSALDSYAADWSAKMAAERRMYHSDLSFPGSPRGENVAAGYVDAASVMRGWMNSPGHRSNILNPSFTKIGVGMKLNYWTQVFAGGAIVSPPPKPPQSPAPNPGDGRRPESHIPHDHYTVKLGDTLSGIAGSLKVDGGWQELHRWNTKIISNPNLIYPGQELNVPRAGSATPAPAPKPPQAPAPKPPAPSSEYAAPIAAKLTQAFRNPGAGYTLGYHTGVDFSAPTGTRVNAVSNGTVVASDTSSSYGINVQIKNADGTYSLYAHLAAKSVSVGQAVKAGQQIGLVGSTGNSSGPHLHLEIRTAPRFGASNFLDPVAWLRSHGVSL